jgi:hypothetical protein
MAWHDITKTVAAAHKERVNEKMAQETLLMSLAVAKFFSFSFYVLLLTKVFRYQLLTLMTALTQHPLQAAMTMTNDDEEHDNNENNNIEEDNRDNSWQQGWWGRDRTGNKMTRMTNKGQALRTGEWGMGERRMVRAQHQHAEGWQQQQQARVTARKGMGMTKEGDRDDRNGTDTSRMAGLHPVPPVAFLNNVVTLLPLMLNVRDKFLCI